jgi:uncharacterized iron-regulated protein
MRFLSLIVIVLFAAACSTAQPAPHGAKSPHHGAVGGPARPASGPWDARTGEQLTPAQALSRVAAARVVIVGESHTDAWHHVVQLKLYEAMGAPPIALGMEMFQRPYQAPLDAYVAGTIDEAAMLAQTEYASRWGFEPALYAPLWRSARASGAPILALNATRELSRRISKVGLDGLTPDERAQLPPTLDLTNAAHRAWVRGIFEGHGMPMDDATFERFYAAQVCWDETMAHAAATYLGADPQRRMFIMAGSGHVIHDHGIPSRLARTIPRAQLLTVLPISRADSVDLASERANPRADILWVE